MARILPDHEIVNLIGKVLIDADQDRVNPNGIELRLGGHAYFHSTGERKNLTEGQYLRVSPGETVIISSLEKLDFTRETVQKIYPEQMITAFITPTTTMMREGIFQVATKVDAGFRGHLNWAFRNSSTQDFIIGYGEPLFKITFFLLDSTEAPETAYGDGEMHQYQDTDGIKLSVRRNPVQIPQKAIVSSSFKKLDPKRQLKEAGYPFDHISTELTDLHGKWEIVSSDVKLIKEDFRNQAASLGTKISQETEAVSKRLDDFHNTFLEKVDGLFQKKFLWIVGSLIAALAVIASICNYLREQGIDKLIILIMGILAGIVTLIITYMLAKRVK
jgi:deoxycytidine triphosphate deaminase